MSHSDSAPVPIPDLRIVPTESLLPHEEHDSQRSAPLIERLRHEAYVINPPVVTPMDGNRYVILDGANRCHAFQALGYPHSVIQVVTYDSGYVDLLTWSHVVGAWRAEALLHEITRLPDVEASAENDTGAPIHVWLRDDRVWSLRLAGTTLQQQNAALCAFVRAYQQRARLNRTAIRNHQAIWDLYEDAIAFVTFPLFTPADILRAAHMRAYLPPGVSRHVIHGRALRINYPIAHLRDEYTTLEEKNQALKKWFQHKLINRQVRYYAESTYQFDE